MDERKSTISKSILPVGQSTRELWDAVVDCAGYSPNPDRDAGELLQILADADARDPYAVGNLLYAWRTGQLA
jgi:hypothetical protein